MSQDPQVFNPDEAEVHFPFVPFVVSVVLNTAAAALLYFFLSWGMFVAEMSMPLYIVVFWMAMIGIPLSLFEYLYHRYMLHNAIFPFLMSMCRSHRHHHSLTNVTTSVKEVDTKGWIPVANNYPIEETEQEASMHFPLYSLIIFQAVFGILLALPLKLLFPGAPVLLAAVTTITVYFVWYEVWHMIQHLPFTKFWKPLLDRSAMVRWVYNFHLVHHFRQNLNMAVVGFYGVAIWDHVFRTCYRMRTLPVKGARVELEDATRKLKPRFPISKVDSWRSSMERWSRKVEAWGRRLLRIKEPVR